MTSPETTHEGEILIQGSDYYEPDFVSQVKRYFEEEWKTDNTDGDLPIVGYAEVHKEEEFSQGDYITLYGGLHQEDPLFINYSRENILSVVTVEMLTSGDRPHMVKMRTEAKRVILAHRKDFMGDDTRLTGKLWAEWKLREQPPKTKKDMYRNIADVQVHWVAREIQT